MMYFLFGFAIPMLLALCLPMIIQIHKNRKEAEALRRMRKECELYMSGVKPEVTVVYSCCEKKED